MFPELYVDGHGELSRGKVLLEKLLFFLEHISKKKLEIFSAAVLVKKSY